MMLVTMTRALRPWSVGDDAFVPDDIAEKLLAAGDAENPRTVNGTAADPAVKKPQAPSVMRPATVPGRKPFPAKKPYRTKGR